MSKIFYTILAFDAKYFYMNVIYAFIVILIFLFFVIAAYSIYYQRRERNQKRWENSVTDLINEIIFSENEDAFSQIIPKQKELLQSSHYRQFLIDEIIKTKKLLSGTFAIGLKKLYEELQLNKHSLSKLSSYSWKIKAKGVQELSAMEQDQYVKNIFRLTTHENETVRNQAQCGLVSYYGFEGLRFLNVTIYPISEWQQIQLLSNLSIAIPQNTAMIKKWLRSSMESVVVFSLKLACFYNDFSVYDDVANCLVHPSTKVKLYALEYLKKIPTEETAKVMIRVYARGDKRFRLAVIDAFKYMGSIDDVSFLLGQLEDMDNDVKAAAAAAIMFIHPSGNEFLQTLSYASISPWKTIFKQVNNEVAA